MKIIHKYILLSFIKWIFIIQIFIISIYLFASTIQHTRFIEKYGSDMGTILYFDFMKIPYSIYQTLPIASVFAVVIVMVLLLKNNELLVYMLSGRHILNMTFPVSVAALFITLLMIFIGDYVNPRVEYARAIFKRINIEKKQGLLYDKISDVWIKEDNSTFLYVNLIDPIGKYMNDIRQYKFDENFRPTGIIKINFAKYSSGKWICNDITSYSVGESIRLVDNKSEQFIKNSTFNSLIDIPDDNPKVLTLSSLKKIIDFYEAKGINSREYRLIFYNKLSHPISVIILIIFVIPLCINLTRHFSYILIASRALFAGFLYWLVYISFISLGKTSAIPPFAANFVPIIAFFIISMYLMVRKVYYNI